MLQAAVARGGLEQVLEARRHEGVRRVGEQEDALAGLAQAAEELGQAQRARQEALGLGGDGVVELAAHVHFVERRADVRVQQRRVEISAAVAQKLDDVRVQARLGDAKQIHDAAHGDREQRCEQRRQASKQQERRGRGKGKQRKKETHGLSCVSTW